MSANSLTRIRGRQMAGTEKENERAFVRLGKGATQILTGVDDCRNWDDEELRRGRRRDKNGGWQGADPTIVPKAVHDELVRRTLSNAEKLLRESLEDAIAALVAIATNPQSDEKARVKAIQMIMDRVMGKETQKVEVSGQSKWEVALLAGIVTVPVEEPLAG